MPHIDDLMPSKTMKKNRLPDPMLTHPRPPKGVRVIIDHVGMGEPLGFQDKKINVLYLKPHPYFCPGETLPIPLSGAMIRQIASITGELNWQRWGGQEIVIFHDPTVESSGRAVGGIRARAPQGAGRPVVTQQPPPASVQPPQGGGLQYPAALSMPDDREPGMDDEEAPFDVEPTSDGEDFF